MRHFTVMLFALAGGLTLSSIVANVYRLVARKPRTRAATWIFYGVMLLAGPSVLLENSTRSFRRKECSRSAYAFAMGLAGYWSFVLGLALINASEII